MLMGILLIETVAVFMEFSVGVKVSIELRTLREMFMRVRLTVAVIMVVLMFMVVLVVESLIVIVLVVVSMPV